MNKIQLFDAYYLNSVGVWYFIPEDIEKYLEGKPTMGFGCIKYAEGSLYTGEVYFDGDQYYKEGYGQQEFTFSSIGEVDVHINEKKYKFVGHYDYKRNNWIYGNGVLYYVDLNGRPSRFVKGYFRALDKVHDFEGEFDYSTLLDGYTKEMESDYDLHRHILTTSLKKYEDMDKIDTLFIGDSYFEFWNYPIYAGSNTMDKSHDSKTNLNLGVGGSTYEDWLDYLKNLKGFKCPKNIVINLGFNDLHCGYPFKTVLENAQVLYKFLKTNFYKSRIVFLHVTHAPGFTDKREIEDQFNEVLENKAIEYGFETLDLNPHIEECKENCFDSDLVHLNEKGYDIFVKCLKELKV